MDRTSIQERFGIVGESDVIKNVIDQARQVADTDITVLLQGESGVGKELISQVLHELSMRRHEQMVVVNCGAIPEGLIESELFGAEKGAYTGAVEERVGYFEEADDGTIFLDEIGEMPKNAQVPASPASGRRSSSRSTSASWRRRTRTSPRRCRRATSGRTCTTA